MKRRLLTALLCVLLLLAAVSVPVFAGNAVSFDVCLKNDTAEPLQASLIDWHLTVTGGAYQSFTARNGSGVTAEASGTSVRLCRTVLDNPLTVPANGSLVIGRITVSGTGVAFAHAATDDGVTSPGSETISPLTVTVVSGTSDIPALTSSGAILSGNLAEFKLSTTPEGTTYLVYADPTSPNPISGVSASAADGKLTLTFQTAPPAAGVYYVSAVTAGSAESARIPVNVWVKTESQLSLVVADTRDAAQIFCAQYRENGSCIRVQALSLQAGVPMTISTEEDTAGVKLFFLDRNYLPLCAPVTTD